MFKGALYLYCKYFFGNYSFTSSQVFYKKGAIKNFSKFTEKHRCLSFFFNKVCFAELVNFAELAEPVNFAEF